MVSSRRFEYRILGTLDVVRDGQPVPIRSAAQRIILAALLVGHGRLVPTGRLLDRLGDAATPTRNALQSQIKRLRATLGAAEQIIYRHDGYLVPDDACSIDLVRFDDLVVQARVSANAGNRGAALSRLREAVRFWRGPILADVPEPYLHATDVNPLTERCLDVCEQRFELELAVGDTSGIVEELTALCAQYPARERLLGQLMRALLYCGRQVDALAAYRAHTGWLRAEFGLEPGPDLRARQVAILRGDSKDALAPAPARSLPQAPVFELLM